jgi:hypothetical protein
MHIGRLADLLAQGCGKLAYKKLRLLFHFFPNYLHGGFLRLS